MTIPAACDEFASGGGLFYCSEKIRFTCSASAAEYHHLSICVASAQCHRRGRDSAWTGLERAFPFITIEKRLPEGSLRVLQRPWARLSLLSFTNGELKTKVRSGAC